MEYSSWSSTNDASKQAPGHDTTLIAATIRHLRTRAATAQFRQQPHAAAPSTVRRCNRSCGLLCSRLGCRLLFGCCFLFGSGFLFDCKLLFGCRLLLLDLSFSSFCTFLALALALGASGSGGSNVLIEWTASSATTFNFSIFACNLLFSASREAISWRCSTSN